MHTDIQTVETLTAALRDAKQELDRSRNETQEALERQTATAEILKVIASSPSDVQPVFDAIVGSVARLFGRKAALRTMEPEGLMRRARSYVPAAGEFHGPDVEPLDRRSIVGHAVLEGRALQWADTLVDGAAAYGMERARQLAFRSIASAPLMLKGRAIGVISVSSPNPGTLSEKQMELLSTFADQAVIAIQNVRLFNETKEALERQTATAEILRVIASSPDDTQPVFDAIAESAKRLFGARGALVTRVAGDRLQLVAFTSSGDGGNETLKRLFSKPLPPSDTHMIVVRTGKPLLRGDIENNPEVSPEVKEVARTRGYQSLLTVPMLRDGVAIGTIAVTRPEAGPFTDHQISLLETFADQAVIAIENVRLFRELEEKSAQLELASHHKSDFLASMSHELRTPLNAILGFNELILAEIYGTVPEDMKVPLADIQTSGKHLLRLINNVLDLAKIEAGRMELALADYSVHDTVESVRSTLRPLAAEKGLEFLASILDDIPIAYGDSGRITQCLMNLAGNSLKFTKAGKVEIVVALQGATLVYRVNDTGIGIPPEKIDSLFTEFKQTDATIASEYGGTGLGLSISKKFIEMHGGRVWVESELGKGSSFIFQVPLRVEVVRGAES